MVNSSLIQTCFEVKGIEFGGGREEDREVVSSWASVVQMDGTLFIMCQRTKTTRFLCSMREWIKQFKDCQFLQLSRFRRTKVLKLQIYNSGMP